ncbi:hypothetical protein CEJ83_20800, partial [Acinetobacter baumannii]
FDYVKSEIYVFITMEIHGVGLDWVRVKAMSYSVSYMLQMILAIMKFLVYMFGLFLFLSFVLYFFCSFFLYFFLSLTSHITVQLCLS